MGATVKALYAKTNDFLVVDICLMRIRRINMTSPAFETAPLAGHPEIKRRIKWGPTPINAVYQMGSDPN
jgi:hypothetical protein